MIGDGFGEDESGKAIKPFAIGLDESSKVLRERFFWVSW